MCVWHGIYMWRHTHVGIYAPTCICRHIHAGIITTARPRKIILSIEILPYRITSMKSGNVAYPSNKMLQTHISVPRLKCWHVITIPARPRKIIWSIETLLYRITSMERGKADYTMLKILQGRIDVSRLECSCKATEDHRD